MYNALSNLNFVILQRTLVFLGEKHTAITILVTVILLLSVKLLHGILVNHLDRKGLITGTTSLQFRAITLFSLEIKSVLCVDEKQTNKHKSCL